MPDAPGLELIRGEIERDRPGAVLATSFDRDQPALIVDPSQVIDVLTWLRDTPGQGYRFLSSLHAADYLPAEPRFGIHYELLNRDRVERIRVKAMLSDPAADEPATADGVSGQSPRTDALARPQDSAPALPHTPPGRSPRSTPVSSCFPRPIFKSGKCLISSGSTFEATPT